MTSLRTGFILAAILVATSVQAQSPQPYGIATFGEFRKMAMQRDYAAKATLAAVVANGATDGVGAVTDARGEVTIVDGKAIVSYGKETDRLPPASETAMLLATAAVREWQEVRVNRDVKPAELESFLAGEAKSRGIDPEKSFPFRLRGTLTTYVMHVTTGPGSGHPPLAQDTQKGDAIAGLVVGVYVAPQLVGVATHPGERTHSHWISEERTATTHLDAWGIKSGAVLLLPK
ncbi:MAG: acetolactate decarboxylase [Xanthobacteraceae bacterium]